MRSARAAATFLFRAYHTTFCGRSNVATIFQCKQYVLSHWADQLMIVQVDGVSSPKFTVTSFRLLAIQSL